MFKPHTYLMQNARLITCSVWPMHTYMYVYKPLNQLFNYTTCGILNKIETCKISYVYDVLFLVTQLNFNSLTTSNGMLLYVASYIATCDKIMRYTCYTPTASYSVSVKQARPLLSHQNRSPQNLVFPDRFWQKKLPRTNFGCQNWSLRPILAAKMVPLAKNSPLK